MVWIGKRNVDVKGTIKTLFTQPLKSFSTGWQHIKTPSVPLRQNIVTFSPSGGVGAIKTGGNILSKAWTGLKTITTKKTINPAVGVSGAGNIAKVLGKSMALGATTFGIGFTGHQLAKGFISGKVPDPQQFSKGFIKSVGTGAGFGLSPVGGGLGALQGLGINLQDLGKKGYDYIGSGDYARWMQQIKKPDVPSYEFPQFKTPDINFTSPSFNLSVPQAEMPSFNMTMPSYSPNLSVGGGDSFTPLLLTLLAGGGLGYALGRKRRKKKYKKRKRRK